MIIGIVGIVKNRHIVGHRPRYAVNTERRNLSQNTGSTTAASNINSINTKGGLVYGPEVWPVLGKKCGYELKILDMNIPEVAKENVEKGKTRIYIPRKICVNGKEKDFTLNSLMEMGRGPVCPVRYYDPSVKDQFGDETAAGWIEIDNGVIPDSRYKDYDTQKDMVEKIGCRMPSVLEAVVLNLMVFAFTGEQLYGEKPLTYTRCSQKVNNKDPVVVGDFTFFGLMIAEGDFKAHYIGVAAVRDL